MAKKITAQDVLDALDAMKRDVNVDPQEIDKARKRMSWAVSFLIVKYHFVYQVLGMMTKTCTPGLGTMGVRVIGGGNFELIYDPLFVNGLKDEELTYVMYHEILHLALHHCTHRRFDNHQIGNLATDLAVNELIPVDPKSCVPPTNEKGELTGCFVSELKKIPDFKDIKEKQTSEWYYDFLKKHAKEDPNGGKGEPGKDGLPGGEGSFDDHGGWKEDEIADEKIRAKIDEVHKNNGWGTVEGAAKEIILAAQTRKINWRNLLRQFYGNMVWHERESTRKRPNRRTGYIHPGERKIQLDRHLVAIDTSGSIDSGLLAQFLGTINQMTDFVPIDIMQFDWAVTEAPKPFDRRCRQYDFKGRGGTCFQPVMDVVTSRRYKSVVILTDGEAGAPTKPNARVVWCMPTGCKPPVDWGLNVFMSNHD